MPYNLCCKPIGVGHPLKPGGGVLKKKSGSRKKNSGSKKKIRIKKKWYKNNSN
jgi:hypothetical protein